MHKTFCRRRGPPYARLDHRSVPELTTTYRTSILAWEENGTCRPNGGPQPATKERLIPFPTSKSIPYNSVGPHVAARLARPVPTRCQKRCQTRCQTLLGKTFPYVEMAMEAQWLVLPDGQRQLVNTSILTWHPIFLRLQP